MMLELARLKQRVDEFNDYAELDMMVQYIADLRVVQKRMGEVQENIAWINNEELLYKYPQTKFHDVDEINGNLDPFSRLFQAVVKWQKSEKKYVRISSNLNCRK